MDFIEWCDRVLDKLIEMAKGDLQVRSYGTDEWDIARAIWGVVAVAEPEFFQSKARLGLLDALEDLNRVRLVGAQGRGGFVKPTPEGEAYATDKTGLWEGICSIELKPEQAQLLSMVNQLSEQDEAAHVWLDWVNQDILLPKLAWPDGMDLLMAVAGELEDMVLIRSNVTMGPHIELKAVYQGLVWERRRGFTLESKLLDDLAQQWETTSVDFKRELETKTADQKAELVKDAIALANTQASGPRILIVGFDDKTRGYAGPPNPKITQEHLEQLMSQYTEPVIDIRYGPVEYRLGLVTKLEVIRDPKKLPYRVRKSVGDKKRIEAGDVFVRHGSLTEKPTPDELDAIRQEGARARGEDI